MLFAKLSAFAATTSNDCHAGSHVIRSVIADAAAGALIAFRAGSSSSIAETFRFTAEHRRGKTTRQPFERMMFCMSRVSVYFVN